MCVSACLYVYPPVDFTLHGYIGLCGHDFPVQFSSHCIIKVNIVIYYCEEISLVSMEGLTTFGIQRVYVTEIGIREDCLQ